MEMKAVIMAGGRGTRLRPLTGSMPKPMVPILDKPVLALTVSSLVRSGITDIAMTLGYMPERIINYFGNGSKLGARITYFVESTPLGTSGGVKNAAKFIDRPFVVMSGDALTDFNIGEFVKYHENMSCLCTLAAKRVADPRGMGEVVPGIGGRIAALREKPQKYTSDLVNMGIYAMQEDILKHIPSGVSDFSKDIFPEILSEMRLYIADCYWSDIGTLIGYYSANIDAAMQPARFGLKIV